MLFLLFCLFASIIDFSDILETPSYFVLPPWCVKPTEDYAGSDPSERKKIYNVYIKSFSWKLKAFLFIT